MNRKEDMGSKGRGNEDWGLKRRSRDKKKEEKRKMGWLSFGPCRVDKKCAA